MKLGYHRFLCLIMAFCVRGDTTLIVGRQPYGPKACEQLSQNIVGSKEYIFNATDLSCKVYMGSLSEEGVIVGKIESPSGKKDCTIPSQFVKYRTKPDRCVSISKDLRVRGASHDVGYQKADNGQYLSNGATCRCTVGFKECSNKTKAVCLPNGLWDNVTGLCRQYKWNNPTTGTPLYIPCGPSSRFSVTIYGTPISADRFNVKLMSGEKILLYLNFRNDPRKKITYIQPGYFLGGKEFRGKKLKVWTMSVGKEFNLNIRLIDKNIEINLYGRSLLHFPARVLLIPDNVEVNRDVSLRLVQINQ